MQKTTIVTASQFSEDHNACTSGTTCMPSATALSPRTTRSHAGMNAITSGKTAVKISQHLSARLTRCSARSNATRDAFQTSWFFESPQLNDNGYISLKY